jgi:hypothetical protein
MIAPASRPQPRPRDHGAAQMNVFGFALSPFHAVIVGVICVMPVVVGLLALAIMQFSRKR